jgi:hypothetical protein
VGGFGSAANKFMVRAGRHMDDGGKVDVRDPYRAARDVKHGRGSIFIVADVQAPAACHGKEREKLTGARCDNEKLLRVEPVWASTKRGVRAEWYFLLGGA